ncbi:MAG: DUF167 family protein [bacterium]|nr:DUF167 family protein [bacterium]
MYIKVRVKAGSKKETLEQKSKDHYSISVKEKAERNMVNKRIIEIIAHRYALPLGKVRIVSGHQSPSKILSVDNSAI